MATNYVSIGIRIAPDIGAMQLQAGGGPPPVTFRGLWFTRVWWPLLMLGPSLYALRFTRWSSHG